MMSIESGTMLDVMAHIQQSIINILWTRYGTRVQREDYGSLLPELIDAPADEATQLRVAASVFMALATWEPRISVKHVDVKLADSKCGFLIIVTAEVNGKAEKFVLD